MNAPISAPHPVRPSAAHAHRLWPRRLGARRRTGPRNGHEKSPARHRSGHRRRRPRRTGPPILGQARASTAVLFDKRAREPDHRRRRRLPGGRAERRHRRHRRPGRRQQHGHGEGLQFFVDQRRTDAGLLGRGQGRPAHAAAHRHSDHRRHRQRMPILRPHRRRRRPTRKWPAATPKPPRASPFWTRP